MSYDIKMSQLPKVERSPQQKKLNRLIERIEQQKQELAAWQNAQDNIQPVYGRDGHHRKTSQIKNGKIRQSTRKRRMHVQSIVIVNNPSIARNRDSNEA